MAWVKVADVDLAKFAAELRVVDARFTPADGVDGYAKQLAEWRAREPDVEVLLSTGDAAGAWLTLVVCKRYGVTTFRGKRQKPTTIGVRAPRGFIDKVLRAHIGQLAGVFAAAKTEAMGELSTLWLGAARAAEPLYVDEDR